MKKTGLLNRPLSEIIAAMGHTDLLVVADAGLPPLLDVVRAIAGELQVEALTVADELLARDTALPDALRALLPDATPHHVPHEEFKRLTARARAIVRTGECTPYNNVILTSGVIF